MKADYHNMLGKEVTLTSREAVWHLVSAICESIQFAENDHQAGKNFFGRPLAYSTSPNISFSIGFASTGLRAGIILSSDEISSNTENISQAARLHIPLVILAGISSQFQVNQLSQSGAVVFSASSAQEALDLLLVSYRIAELSLIPVVVCMEETISHIAESVLFPGKEMIVNFAGNTDHLIPSPTASQQIIFGKNRKRIPTWFNVDIPVSIGSAKQQNESALETAARQEYFYSHLDEIMIDSFREFNKVSGRFINDIELPTSKDADYLVISYGSISASVVKATEEYRLKNKIKIAAARLVRISPFPAKSMKTILLGKKAITVLEQAIAGTGMSDIFREISCLPETRTLKMFSGSYGEMPASGSWTGIFNNMLPDGKGKTKFWIEVDFTHPDSDYPKHQVLLEVIRREYPDAKDKTISSLSVSKSRQHPGNSIPLSIRKYKDHGPSYSKLSRFYDDTASFFLTDKTELVADPFQAIPVMPPSTAGFNSATPGNEARQLPVFNASNCTGCGDCFLQCPHSAINPLVIGIENLVKAGMAVSNANGVKITHLIPLVKNIAKNIHLVIKQKRGGVHSVSDFLTEAFATVSQQLKLEGDKLQGAKQDLEAVVLALKELPVSVTDIFYNNPDVINNGSGDLFSLAVDVHACTGCALCVTACNDDALKMEAQNPDLITSHQTTYSLWEQLPDTNAGTIIHLLDQKTYNPFSALLLSRYFNQALNGISNDKDGDSSKSMIRLIIALAEASIQPRFKEAIATIDDLVTGLSSKIHAQFGSALPRENFESLSKILSDIKDDRSPFEKVIEKLGTGNQLGLVDTKSLKRKVELAKSLRTLKWLLSDGSTGSGRSRMGFAIDGSLAWSNSYPWNNFTSPVLILRDGTTPELAKGIVQGQIRQLLDNIKIMRRAELEINGSYEPEINDEQIASLTWNDLTEKEKNLVPPVIVIGSRVKLAGRDLDSLVSMLNGNWPLKAIVLDDAAPGSDDFSTEIIGGMGTLLSVMALQNAQVIKSSLAVPQHLFSGLSEAFNSNKPALAWVYVPSVSKHQVSSGSFPKLHTLCLNSRAFPVFNFNPNRDENLLSSKIEMQENPQAQSTWVQSDLSFHESGEEKTLSYTLTWADWAYTLKSWREKFKLHADVMGQPVLVAEFILLSKPARIGKSPVIFRKDENGELKKYQVPDEVVSATEACVRAWQVLREISGELTEFPDKLHRKIEAELTVAYEKKMAESNQFYENKIANLEREHLEKIRVRLREKLVMLSRQPRIERDSSNGKQKLTDEG